jgi:hypothetical protein
MAVLSGRLNPMGGWHSEEQKSNLKASIRPGPLLQHGEFGEKKGPGEKEKNTKRE